MAYLPIAVFYDEWGMPEKVRYVGFWQEGIEVQGYCTSDFVDLFPEKPVHTKLHDVSLDVVAANQEIWCGTGNTESSTVNNRDNLCLVGMNSITAIRYDGKVCNDTIRTLCTCIENTGERVVLALDWKGNAVWMSWDILDKAVDKGLIKVSDDSNDSPFLDLVYLKPVEEYRSDRVKSLIDREIATVNLLGYNGKIDPCTGNRVLELPNIESALVSSFWNIVRHKDNTLRTLCCPEVGALYIESPQLVKLKAPEVCMGLEVECGTLQELSLPRVTKELHTNGGVWIWFSAISLPADYTVLDMSEWHDLAYLVFGVKGAIGLQKVVLMLPRKQKLGSIERPACEVNSDTLGILSRAASQFVFAITECPNLKELVVVDNNCSIPAPFLVSLSDAMSLRSIVVDTVCDALKLCLLGLRSVVSIMLRKGAHMEITTRGAGRNYIFKICLAPDFDRTDEDWSIKFVTDKMKATLVTTDFDRWISLFEKPSNGSAVLLVCCPSELSKHIKFGKSGK